MGIEGVGATHEAGHVDSLAEEPIAHAPESGATHDSNSVSAFGPSNEADLATHAAAPAESGGPDFFKMLGDLFGGGQQGNGAQSANRFDLGAILASIFDFAGKNENGGTPAPTPENPAHQESSEHVGVRKEVEVSGETGDEHFKATGRAKAEAHAEANANAQSYNDGRKVGAKASVDASVGASAEVEGNLKTDIGTFENKARVSAEAAARASAEAEAGPDGAHATAKSEVEVMAKARADSNMNLGDGLVTGHADARAQAGAGAQAVGNVGVTVNPPSAVMNAKAEAFAGARAGYSAKGGVAGANYGVEVEVWAGVGARAEINGGLDKNGKFKLEFAIGIAYGVGAQFKVNVEIDTKVMAKTIGKVVGVLGMGIGGIIGAVASMFSGKKSDGEHAQKTVTQAFQQVAPYVGQAVAGAASDQAKKYNEDHKEENERTTRDEVKMSRSGTLAEGSLT